MIPYLLGSIEFLAILKLSFDKNTQKCSNLQDMSELREITVRWRGEGDTDVGYYSKALNTWPLGWRGERDTDVGFYS
jgi:hypothetical protein